MPQKEARIGRKPLAHRLGPFSLFAAVAIAGWAWWTSDRPPSGCYRVNAGSYLAGTREEVRLLMPDREERQASIVATDRIRGYVLKLGRELSPAPTGIPPDARTLVIFEDSRDRPHAVLKSAVASSPRFYEIRCIPSALDPLGAHIEGV